MYRTIIVDDEKPQQKLIQKLLASVSKNYEVVAVCSTVMEAEKQLVELEPDLVFLDIEMPPYTGFDLLEMIPEINFEIIFCTAHSQYAFKAFKVAAVDYLLKPFGRQELKQALNRFEEKMNQRPLSSAGTNTPHGLNIVNEGSNTIALPTGNGFEFVPVGEILYSISVRNYTNVFLVSGRQLVVPRSCKECEEILRGYGFVRIHKATIVNQKFIKSYTKGDGGSVEMTNGTQHEVSRLFKREFLDQFRKL